MTKRRTANNKTNNRQKLSVIIPLFNEPRILNNLKTIEEELKKSFGNYEIIVVNDGSTDITAKQLRKYHSAKVKIMSYLINLGKGSALRRGFSRSKGNLVAFIDGDLELHPKQISLFADLLNLTQADIVIGSKRHPLSQVKYPPIRRIYSRIYQFIIKILFGLNITDSQVGIKLFKRKVLEKVLPLISIKQWAFDLEVLVVAYHLGFKRIIEAPIELKMRPFGSHIDTKAVLNVLNDTLAIFYRRFLIKYYDRKLPYKVKDYYRLKYR